MIAKIAVLSLILLTQIPAPAPTPTPAPTPAPAPTQIPTPAPAPPAITLTPEEQQLRIEVGMRGTRQRVEDSVFGKACARVRGKLTVNVDSTLKINSYCEL